MTGRVTKTMGGHDVHNPLFARIYTRLSAKGEERGAAEHRKRLLAGLSGRVVEVGAGHGLNLSHYPSSVSEVVAVEPESYLRARAGEAAQEVSMAVSIADGVADALPLADGSVDAGVASFVLCTVPDQARALAELRRVIRPGGELRFYEHVASDRPAARAVERALDVTIWPRVGAAATSPATRKRPSNAPASRSHPASALRSGPAGARSGSRTSSAWRSGRELSSARRARMGGLCTGTRRYAGDRDHAGEQGGSDGGAADRSRRTGCLAMMGAAMVVLPRVGRRLRRSPRIRPLIGRLRRRSMIDRVLSWVEEEQPDLAGATAPDGTVTILFTDIENSTALNERLGDRRWLEVLRAHNSIVRRCVGEHGGYEVKSQGDGFMIAYPSARRGLECAVDMQRNLTQLDHAPLDEPLRVRIGLHTGEAIREGDDFYRRSVTLAAALGDEGRGGEILSSSIVRELVGSSADVPFEDAGELQLKGLRGRQRAYRVVWEKRKGARPSLSAVG